MTVSSEDVQNRGRIQTDETSLRRLRVTAAARQAEAIASKRAWKDVLSALGVVTAAVVLLMFFGSKVDFAGEGDRD